MRYIELTQGKYTIVDDKDFEFLHQYKWHAQKDCDTYYAVRHIVIQGQNKSKNIKQKTKIILMHRLIMKNQLKGNEVIDHINRHGLDNRRCNLRVCDYTKNQANSKKREKYNNRKTTSKYKGVHWHKINKKWIARIGYRKKRIYLGIFIIETEAAKAYDQAAKKYFGEFARLNFNE